MVVQKLLYVLLLIGNSFTVTVDAFCVHQPSFIITTLPTTTYQSKTSCRLAKVALEPEPDGGEELAAVTSSMAGCRMKNMGPATNIKSDLGTVHQFWMVAEVEPTLIKEFHQQILKDASRKANFPGFRKGQVPPFALPKIMSFSVREAIIKTVEAAVKSFGLKALPGSDGEVSVKEDTEAICKGFRLGDSVQFTATLNAVVDSDVVRSPIAIESEGGDVASQDEEEALSNAE